MTNRLCYIPLDCRPVCYDLPRRLAATAGVILNMPSPNLMSGAGGAVKKTANEQALRRWMKIHLRENLPVIAALDTVLYGGLIPSRLGDEPIEVLEKRLQTFLHPLQTPALYGFSSILRIPNYNLDEEEPPYWAKYGKQLYQYSEQAHLKALQPAEHTPAEHKPLPEPYCPMPDWTAVVPINILEDFLNRRHRNFAMNQRLLELAHDKILERLVFCQDDTGPHGLNVQEAEHLRAQITQNKLGKRCSVQTGADEVACTMLAHVLIHSWEHPVSICPVFSNPKTRHTLARFDGIDFVQLATQQIHACGALVAKSPASADLILMVHTPPRHFEQALAQHPTQGDHCAGVEAYATAAQVERVRAHLADTNLPPVILADVANANGADPSLMDQLVASQLINTRLYGYAGWNTPGNSVGSALAMGICRFLAEQRGCFKPQAFRELLFQRLADDWWYQARVRKLLREQAVREGFYSSHKNPDEAYLNLEMADGLAMLQHLLRLEALPARCRFPMGRLFEVAIDA